MIETALCRGSRFILAAILWAWILGVPPITVGQQSAKKSPSVKSEVAEVFHYTVKEGSGEITIAAPRYQVTVTREGLGLKVHRGRRSHLRGFAEQPIGGGIPARATAQIAMV